MRNKNVKIKPSKKVCLSACSIWQQQKDFYNTEGINAWTNKIPFYVTSNPYIANSYAQLIIRYIQDCVRNKIYHRSEPFYIIELGAGSGTFSFYTLKRLIELQHAFNMTNITFVYVMTDLVKSNIDFWRIQPNLQQYIEQGVLDFAQFNIESDKTIKLLHSKKVLSKRTPKQKQANPLIILANYVFDTLSQDVFQIVEGELQEGVITSTANLNNIDKSTKWYTTLDQIDPSFEYRPAKMPYYKDSTLNAVLKDYKSKVQEKSRFLIPAGSFHGIQRLLEIANNKLLLIATDKGYSKHSELYTKNEPDLVFHDQCFSMMVNFDAIGKYFQHRGGDYFHQSMQQSIVTSVFTLGLNFANLTETKQAAVTYLDNISHGNLFNFYSHLEMTKYQCDLQTLMSYLAATHWDPRVFDHCFGIILNQINNSLVSVICDLKENIPQIAANFYYLPGTTNTLANIGVFFQITQDYRSALSYYQQSLSYFDQVDTVFYNMGLCHYFLEEYTEAIAKFRQALKLSPHYIMAKGWIAQVESLMHEKANAC